VSGLKITWINSVPIVEAGGRRTCERVCVRLRSAIPSEGLARRGHDVRCYSLSEVGEAARGADFFERDVFVFGKVFGFVLPLVQAIRRRGRAKVVADLCDNVFAPPEDELAPFYGPLLPLVDGAIVSSERLGEALAGHLPAGARRWVVADSVEYARQEPRFAPEEGRLRLMWFGYPNNFPLLADALPGLWKLAGTRRVELAAVGQWGNVDVERLTRYAEPIGLRCVGWTEEAMGRELAGCDVVVIPSDDSPARVTKSANRVITGLWAGRYVVASPLPSYEEFAGYAGIGRDLCGGIEWAMGHAGEVRERIGAGQGFIDGKYGVERVVGEWEGALQAVCGG
jgi:hypothetical protein